MYIHLNLVKFVSRCFLALIYPAVLFIRVSLVYFNSSTYLKIKFKKMKNKK